MASFDTLSREWLLRFVEYRIGDRRIIHLIQKWLKAGMLGGVAGLVGIESGVVSGCQTQTIPALPRRWRPRHAKQ